MRLTTLAGWAAAASLPPLIREMRTRSAFIAEIGAPLASSALLSAISSSSVRLPAGRRQQRRAPAADERHDEIVRGHSLDRLEQGGRTRKTRGIWNRMSRFHHLDGSARRAVAIARDDHAFERSVPKLLEGLCKLRRALDSPDHNGFPLGLLRNERLQRLARSAAFTASSKRLARKLRGSEMLIASMSLVFRQACL